MMGLFDNRKQINGQTAVPVWFMRQAGRYHSHYQNIKKDSDFMTMCRTPELACEITMGPIEDFGFDAAILFSDLLFPLEHLGLGLNYLQGPPKLEYHLKDRENAKKLTPIAEAKEFYDFQGKACTLLKEKLPKEKTLLGFVGAPFTLYTYATEGSHAGSLFSAKKGLYDGLWNQFTEVLFPNLMEEMFVQARGGADAVCLFDTAAGELGVWDYKNIVVPQIKKITKAFKQEFPNKKIIYYSKHTHLNHLHTIEDDNIDVLGVDWRHDLAEVFDHFGKDYMIQGNIDPCWLHLEWQDLEKNLIQYRDHLKNKNIPFDKWIAGLGHGVLIETPEENVRRAVKFFQNEFLY